MKRIIGSSKKIKVNIGSTLKTLFIIFPVIIIFYICSSIILPSDTIYPFDEYYIHWGPSEPLEDLVTNYQPVRSPNQTYIHSTEICKRKNIYVLILVKSRVDSYEVRESIRRTWGGVKDVDGRSIRTIFFVGLSKHSNSKLDTEALNFSDVVQGNFEESYYNLTEKSIMTISWAFSNCKNVPYFFLVDDDYYISPYNIIRFIKTPSIYPTSPSSNAKKSSSVNQPSDYSRHYFSNQSSNAQKSSSFNQSSDNSRHNLSSQSFNSQTSKNSLTTKKSNNFSQSSDYSTHYNTFSQSFISNTSNNPSTQLAENSIYNSNPSHLLFLYAGYVLKDNFPERSWTNKHYMSPKAYPYKRYPPYITGGSSIISYESLKLLYLGCLYTNYFNIDDVFLGMAAYKANLTLTHNKEFHLNKVQNPKNFKNAIAMHGYKTPKDIVQIWELMKS